MKKYLVLLLGAGLAMCFALFAMKAESQSIRPPQQLALDDMAATMRIQPLPNGGSLQRIPLPADLIMHSQTPDLADLRLFNSGGEPVPFALRSSAAEFTSTTAAKVTLKAFPIRDSGKLVAAGSATVRIESRGDEMNVLIDRTVLPANSKANRAAATATTITTESTTVGVLFDTRAIEGQITSIEFDMDLPANQVIPITIEATRDFLNWEVIASAQSVYRFSYAGGVGYGGVADAKDATGHAKGGIKGDASNAGALALTTVELRLGTTARTGIAIMGRYLRVTWPIGLPQKNQSAVVIRGATMTTESASRMPIAQPKRNLGTATVFTPHALMWQLGSPLRLRALMLTTEQTGTLLPIVVLGRDNDKQTWRRIGETVLFRLETAGPVAGKQTITTNAPLRLNGVSVRQLRIEVPSSSANIAANLVAAAIEYDGQEIIAAVKPSDEMRVAVGYFDAPSVALPIQTIVPEASALKIEQLPLMMIEPARFYPERLAQVGASPATERKNYILWGVLLLGVAVLAAMAWGTVRQLQTTKT